ncbi:PpiC-type peptidyl-prolyl cis-trans isomerase [Oceaniovalibus guishaninsula JLT2003]|uniref:Parvulin-like PPIase n=1 Tax=Oceaniovalibus guishaninsula JLT2003 TaxID=1231392 RepID=K2I6L2_9RHOB|nr:peptidylprolyl isomerase [Oceaniovalibus guishaninsula]EKE44620.1 PpiC-type peptidyl-prolyl cis-trans isomerase [Oceaniovalibus guishaninsula JLT2003]
MPTNLLRRTGAVCALSLTLAAPLAAQDAGTVVATVGDKDITLGHMIALRQGLPAQYQQLDDRTLFDGLLEQLVQQTALAEQVTDPSSRTQLELDNQTRALLAAELLRQTAADAVTDEAIQAAYDAAFSGADPVTEYNAAHILVETEDEAKEIVAQLNDGADFAELAREKSTGPSGPSGGDLGWFGPGQMVGEFDEAVQNMEPGSVSDPVQTQFGWHVIRLNETRQQDAPALDEVRDRLAAEIQQEAAQKLIDEATADIDVTRPETEIDPALVRDDSLLD